MKYLITALMFLSIAHANTEGECRNLFKSANTYIENANATISKLNSLYNKQEDQLVAKDKKAASVTTNKIQAKLMKAKEGYKKAAPISLKAISRCSGRSKKAKEMLTRAKSGIQEVNFKLKVNKRILTDL